jgi:hypothetical protein
MCSQIDWAWTCSYRDKNSNVIRITASKLIQAFFVSRGFVSLLFCYKYIAMITFCLGNVNTVTCIQLEVCVSCEALMWPINSIVEQQAISVLLILASNKYFLELPL